MHHNGRHGSGAGKIGSLVEIDEVVSVLEAGYSGVSLSGFRFGAGVSCSSRHCVLSEGA